MNLKPSELNIGGRGGGRKGGGGELPTSFPKFYKVRATETARSTHYNKCLTMQRTKFYHMHIAPHTREHLKSLNTLMLPHTNLQYILSNNMTIFSKF
jgi:hypothetical protein